MHEWQPMSRVAGSATCRVCAPLLMPWRAAPANPCLLPHPQAASKALEGLSVEQRTAIEQQHAALRAQAAAAGMELPTLGSEAAEQQRGAGGLVLLRRGETAAPAQTPPVWPHQCRASDVLGRVAACRRCCCGAPPAGPIDVLTLAARPGLHPAASAPVGNGSRGSAMAVPGSSSQAGSSAGGQKPDTLVLGGAAPSAAASASGHASAAAPGATGTGAKPAAAGSMAAKPSHAELKAAASKQVLEHKPGGGLMAGWPPSLTSVACGS